MLSEFDRMPWAAPCGSLSVERYGCRKVSVDVPHQKITGPVWSLRRRPFRCSQVAELARNLYFTRRRRLFEGSNELVRRGGRHDAHAQDGSEGSDREGCKRDAQVRHYAEDTATYATA